MQMHSGVGGRVGGKAGRRRRRRKANLMNEINITPFVDVMLVLLIIFMVTAPLLTAGVKIDLPESDAPPLETKQEPLEITINNKGEIFLQETKITLEQLAPKLQAITKRKTDTNIFVRGDKNVGYGKIITVINAINKSGFTKVGLVTDVDNGKK